MDNELIEWVCESEVRKQIVFYLNYFKQFTTINNLIWSTYINRNCIESSIEELCEKNIVLCYDEKVKNKKYYLSEEGLKIQKMLKDLKYNPVRFQTKIDINQKSRETIFNSVKRSKNKKKIISSLIGHSKTVSDLCEETNLNRSAIYSIIKSLINDRIIVCFNPEDKINKRYGLTYGCKELLYDLFEVKSGYEYLSEEYLFFTFDEETIVNIGGINFIIPEDYAMSLECGLNLLEEYCKQRPEYLDAKMFLNEKDKICSIIVYKNELGVIEENLKLNEDGTSYLPSTWGNSIIHENGFVYCYSTGENSIKIIF